MTLVASSPQTTLPTSSKTSYDDVPKSDTESQSSDDEISTGIENYNPVESLVQNLGYPESITAPPQFGQVSIENSSDVHFGDKNIYQGPVTIKQIVYANGTSLVSNSESTIRCKDNLGYENSEVSDSDEKGDPKASEEINCDKSISRGEQLGKVETNDLTLQGRWFKWLQNLLKHKLIKTCLVGIVILFLTILTIVLLLKHPSPTLDRSMVDTSEQDKIAPVKYDPDITDASQIKNKLRFVTRIEWVAQPPINTTTPLVTPVPYVIIHHTATENCSSIARCVLHVRTIQNFHIESKGWYDIAYNFLVGGDGAAYEGRGWTMEGAHSLGYNARSIGIAFIGTFTHIHPPYIQILAAKRLIEQGLELGYIKQDYKLMGARQLAGTESPGLALFQDMKTWSHWAKEP